MPEISLKAEELFHIGSFPFTNGLFLSLIVSALIICGAFLLKRRLALVPSGPQNLAEVMFEGTLGVMDSVLGERHKSEKYLPLVATIFFFVLVSNWFGLFPFVGAIGLHETAEGHEVFIPLFRSPAADLNFTLAIALIAVIATNIFGIFALGPKIHFSKFFNFKGPIEFFIGILEFISEIAKVVSFSFRLFGNVFAGEVLLIITGFLIPYLIPLPFLFLEIFVGFIQAFVFGMLSLVFVAIATIEHGEAHH